MCTTKAPKPQTVPQDQKKPTQYLANPWLDGLGITGAATRGRNALRIDPGGPRYGTNQPTTDPKDSVRAGRPGRPADWRNNFDGSMKSLLYNSFGINSTKRDQAAWDAQYT